MHQVRDRVDVTSSSSHRTERVFFFIWFWTRHHDHALERSRASAGRQENASSESGAWQDGECRIPHGAAQPSRSRVGGGARVCTLGAAEAGGSSPEPDAAAWNPSSVCTIVGLFPDRAVP